MHIVQSSSPRFPTYADPPSTSARTFACHDHLSTPATLMLASSRHQSTCLASLSLLTCPQQSRIKVYGSSLYSRCYRTLTPLPLPAAAPPSHVGRSSAPFRSVFSDTVVLLCGAGPDSLPPCTSSCRLRQHASRPGPAGVSWSRWPSRTSPTARPATAAPSPATRPARPVGSTPTQDLPQTHSSPLHLTHGFCFYVLRGGRARTAVCPTAPPCG